VMFPSQPGDGALQPLVCNLWLTISCIIANPSGRVDMVSTAFSQFLIKLLMNMSPHLKLNIEYNGVRVLMKDAQSRLIGLKVLNTDHQSLAHFIHWCLELRLILLYKSSVYNT
jgi:hypothetical protein